MDCPRLLLIATFCVVLGLSACEPENESALTGDAGSSVLRRGNGGDPGSLDPALAEDVHAFNVLTDMYEGLVSIDADGSIVAGVAESWSVSDDGREYVFSLRNDAKWSDGRRVTASDFEGAFRRVASAELPASYSFLFASIENFADVKSGELPVSSLGVVAVDEQTLVVRLTAGTSYFLSILAMPIASPVYPEADSKGMASGRIRHITNGPFQLAERILDGPIRLTRNTHYWDAASVRVDEVVYLPIVDVNAELNMYRSGELHITNSIPPDYMVQLQQTLGTEVRIAPTLALYYLAFDLTEAPFDNKNLRKALSVVVDRQKLVELIGRGEVAAHSIVPPGVANHAGAEYSWHDLSQSAREDLGRSWFEAAGYGPENPLSITFTYDAGDIHERAALAVASMWQSALGVNVEFEKKEWQLFLATRDDRSAWELMRFAWAGDYDDPMTFLEIFRSDGAQNLPRYDNAVFDQALDSASAETSALHRLTLMTQAEATLIEDYPVIPLYFYVSKHLVKPTVLGFSDNVLDRHPSKSIAVTPELR